LARKKRWFLIGGAILAVPLTLAAVKGIQVLRSIGDGNIIDGFTGIQNPHSKFPQQDRVTILVIGKDYNRDSKGMPYTKSARADTIMLLGVDLNKRTISAVSVPRDLRVTAPDGKVGKINGTYARGGEKLLVGTIQEMLNVKVDYFVALKPDAVKVMVDKVGGVEVTTIDFMKYTDSWGQLNIDLPKGTQTLNGEQAVGFTRFREVNTMRRTESGALVRIQDVKHSLEEGDQRRTERQQQLVRALVASALRPSNLAQADQVIDAGFGQIDTNLKRIQLVALATIFKGGVANMRSSTLETFPQRIDGREYLVLNEKRARAKVDWLINGNQAAMNASIRVAIYNGSKTPGVAKKYAEVLKREGYDVVIGGNTPKPSLTSTVYFAKADYFDQVESIKTGVGGAAHKKFTVGEKPEGLIPQSDLLVVIGEDLGASLSDRLASTTRSQSPESPAPRS
jgi:polyisoprenyl-teichoic acid--peptidoglycan teichoic acid transferase